MNSTLVKSLSENSLSPAVLAFLAEYLRNGGQGTKAALTVRPDYSIATAGVMASRWLALDGAQLWLESVKVATAARAVRNGLLSMEERRQFLADVVRANPENLGADQGHLVQSYESTTTETETGSRTKEKRTIPSKLDAVRLDAQLAGELTPQKIELSCAPDVDALLDRLTGQGAVMEVELVPTDGEPDPFLADLME